MTGYHSKSRQGFTLIEVLVTVAIFSITVLMAVNLFIIFVQQQRRTLNQQELQNDARAVMEQIAKDVREGSIDYDYYVQTFDSGTTADKQKLFTNLTSQATNTSLRDNCLVLRSAVNDQILYRLNGSIIERNVPASPDSNIPCNQIATGWEKISPDILRINSFVFAISPSEDPFASQSALRCDAVSSPGIPVDTLCRWGTICAVPSTTTCINKTSDACYCYPQKFGSTVSLHPRVTFSFAMSRTSNNLTISQTFQTTVASRLFKNLDRLNAYVP